MLRTMLSELAPTVPDGWRWRRGELIRRRAITLVPVAGARSCGSSRAPSFVISGAACGRPGSACALVVGGRALGGAASAPRRGHG